MDIVLHHFLSLTGHIPTHYLAGFFLTLRHSGLSLLIHNRGSSHMVYGELLRRRVKAKVVTPFSLVTVIFSLCCSKMVLTIYRPKP